jgi:hypothetical protein
LTCTCLECVREMVFTYTANPCSEGGPACTDTPGPTDTAQLVIRSGDNLEDELFSGMVTVNDEVTIGTGEFCLPQSIEVTVMDVNMTIVLQATTMDTSCDGRGLYLLNSYGALDFNGYSCDENDVHNCFIDVLYNMTACNIGEIDMTLSEYEFEINGNITDFLASLTPEELVLVPTECIERFPELVVERCADREYCASASVNASLEGNGPICDDMVELKFDFMQASVQPSPSPSLEPSAIPSNFPSEMPSSPPSRAPSTEPSSPPSLGPSPEPSPAPTNECIIDIELGCTPEDGFGETCDDIPIFTQICTERPFEMKFRYNGGDCSQSFNIQPSSLFACFDYNGGPPKTQNVTSYIIASVLGGGEIYFEGFVNTGNIYTLNAAPNQRVAANMNITIYDPRGQTNPVAIKMPANILQTTRYHSSCSRNLFLKDRFGNSQLVEWTSATVGLITCFITASLDISLTNPITATGSAIKLLELNSLTNFDPFIFSKTDEVNGVVLQEGQSFSPTPIVVTLDLTVRQRYNFFTTIVGETIDGFDECNGDDFFEFVAGNPLPPTFPTVAPSASPTFTPFPTPDPETTGCGLDGTVTCVVTDGPTSDCNQLSVPLVTSCITPDNVPLTELRFLNTGQNCGAIPPGPVCTDRNGGPGGATEIFVEISDSDGTYVERVVALGGFVRATNPTGFDRGTLAIRVWLVNRASNDLKGARVQDLVVNTECADGSLVLERDFGTLQLTAFDNARDGLQTLFATYSITYAIENDSVFDATITSALVSSQISGPRQELVPTPPSIGRFETIQILEETQTINLEAASARPAFIFGMSVRGIADTQFMETCTDFPTIFFRVQSA